MVVTPLVYLPVLQVSPTKPAGQSQWKSSPTSVQVPVAQWLTSHSLGAVETRL